MGTPDTQHGHCSQEVGPLQSTFKQCEQPIRQLVECHHTERIMVAFRQHCDFETDECALVDGVPPCANGGECVDLTQSYSCNCAAGYQGDNCALETDECRPNNPCQNGGACTDEFLSFTCVCEPGYGGELCETNLNECDPSPCQHGAD